MFYYIKIGSITNVQRARVVLKRHGIKSTVERIENPGLGDGCGYMLKISENNKDAADLLRNNGISILGVIDE